MTISITIPPGPLAFTVDGHDAGVADVLDDIAEEILRHAPGAKTMRPVDSQLDIYIAGQSEKVRPVRDQLVEHVAAWLREHGHAVVTTLPFVTPSP